MVVRDGPDAPGCGGGLEQAEAAPDDVAGRGEDARARPARRRRGSGRRPARPPGSSVGKLIGSSPHVRRRRTAGLTTSHSSGPAADVDGDDVALRQSRGGVEQRERDPGLQRRARRCPTWSRRPGTSPRITGMCAARDAASGGPQPPGPAPRTRLALGEQGLATPERRPCFQPTANPQRACTRRDLGAEVLAVQRQARLGAQRVAGAEPGGQAARPRRPRRRSASHSASAPAGGRDELVAVLAGVAGAAEPDRPVRPGRRRRRPCSRGRSSLRVRQDARLGEHLRATRGPARPARRARRARRRP